MKKNIETRLTVEYAKKAAGDFKTYLKSAEKPVIDLSNVEKIDLTGIQILIAGQKSAEKGKNPLFYTGALKKSLYDKLVGNGFKIVPFSENEDFYQIRRNSSEF